MRIKRFLAQKFCLTVLLLSFFVTVSFAEGSESSTETHEKFNAGKTIIGHITDGHSWHIMEFHGEPIALPLPVILYSPDKGLSVFMSNKFEDGKADYDGFRLVGNKVVAVNESGQVDDAKSGSIIDISITKNVASILLVAFFMVLMFTSVAKSYKKTPGKAPKGLQNVMEMLILFVRDDIAKSSIGEKHYKKYVPYLLTIFFFIWITNMLGIIPILPGGANVMGNIAVTATLAVLTFIITLFSAKKHYWRHIVAMPGVPAWVLIILTPIEIFGMFLKPLVLTIRLFANMLAGHIIALGFFCLIFIFGEMNTGLGLGVSIFSVAFVVFMTFLELLVAFIQAYVFTLLSAIYFGSAVEEGHHEGEFEHNDQEQQLLV